MRRSRALPGVLALCCLAAVVGLFVVVHRFQPIQTWLAWKLALLWLWEGVFIATCLGLGSGVCRWALRYAPEIPALERLVLMLASGAALFGLLMYVGGALHLLHPAWAVALPVIGIGIGLGRAPRQTTARLLTALRQWHLRMNAIDLLVVGFGALCVGLIYLQILNPGAPNHDAHWTHVAIARDLVRAGKLIAPRAEWAKDFPHLASIFFTWALLVPGLDAAARMPLVMHTEFVFFLGTLVAVVAAVRWMIGAKDAAGGWSWVAFFLFPSIFVYDSSLGGSADHIAAFFVLPLFLAMVRGAAGFSPRLYALAGALAGTALITKYQTAYVTLPLAGLAAMRLAIMAMAMRRRRIPGDRTAVTGALVAFAAALGAGLLAASPYFLENLAFHHNPVYPFMQSLFTGSTPTFPDAPYLVSNVLTPVDLRGAATNHLGSKLWQAAQTVFTFSFLPHYSFLKDRPYFGFLFTILAPLALLLPLGHRLRIASLVAFGALLLWALNYLVDRNLQIILPVLVAVTAGVICRAWSLGWLARAGLIPLCLLQVLWGGDLLFEGYLHGAIEHIRSGFRGQVDVRETLVRQGIARVLPENAVVIFHGDHVAMGIDREVLSDEPGFQGLIDYHQLRTAREAYDRFVALGVTHLVWIETFPGSLLQRDVVFAALVKSLPTSTHGRYRLAAMPAIPPASTAPYRTLAVGLPGRPDGIYPIDVLSRCEMRAPEHCPSPTPERPVSAAALTPDLLQEQVDVVIVQAGRTLTPANEAVLRDRFHLVRPDGPYRLLIKR